MRPVFRREQRDREWEAWKRQRDEDAPRRLSLLSELVEAARAVDLVRGLEQGSTLADLAAVRVGDPVSWPSAVVIRTVVQLRVSLRDYPDYPVESVGSVAA